MNQKTINTSGYPRPNIDNLCECMTRLCETLPRNSKTARTINELLAAAMPLADNDLRAVLTEQIIDQAQIAHEDKIEKRLTRIEKYCKDLTQTLFCLAQTIGKNT
ncbi:hypothetical protein GX645_00560 [Candidatus Sumerlaeota bacterium]|nr:hypothetical protein [Candidatus Sumerlaeota bacterium]